ncbi:drug/metabolite transporter (DMT)-like permease [Actinoplanes lutulentus]|uniref:Drug/metabolite transporter (DMT)-like permease n=1 Tax=Actinoplanes lutulentus TaxID=1287878 RepID=A0A327Z7U2_9ACTN|nr:DMT family transporter [Actinoplanes lutulentus]MBB2948559.1 drug/metabolite transporter (DMT)-like permease [Actinoplanes lutulentus]RAK34409.1 drug/metabolite transporter (DMT)-like permease [Actinoplanes lutulentus]
MPSAKMLPVAAASVTVVLWASAFVGVRAVGHDYSPGALALGRQLFGSAALTVFVLLRHGKPTMPDRRTLLPVLAWGVAWFGLYNLALNSAERHLDAGTTALLVNLAPVLIGVLAGLLLSEGFPARLMIGLAIAFAGVLLIATTSSGRRNLTGVLLGLAAALLYAGGAVTQKRLLIRIDPLTMTWLGCLAGTVFCLPFAPDLFRAVAAAPATSTIGVAYLGLFPTAIAFLTWGYALSRSSAGRLAASTYAIPPLVILLSWLLLDEVPLPLALVGGALCLTGVAVSTFRPGQHPSWVRPSKRPSARATVGAP